MCRRRLAQSQASIVHPTYYWTLDRAGYQRSTLPVVLTVHDFIHERYQAQIRHSAKQIAWKAKAIERADRIVCVSDSTLNDLAQFYPTAACKAVSIPLGCDFRASPSERPVQSDAGYFLYVGGRAGYKNFAVMLPAIKRVVEKKRAYRLKCVGDPFSKEELKAIADAGLASHIECLRTCIGC